LSVNRVDHRSTQPFKEVRTSDSTLPLSGGKALEIRKLWIIFVHANLVKNREKINIEIFYLIWQRLYIYKNTIYS